MLRSLACLAFGMIAWAVIFYSASVQAQSANFVRDCQDWIDKKGYSTDYIEQKIGKRQRGLASQWRGNVLAREVQSGDVALIALSAPGAQHAALVEEVRKNSDGNVTAIRVSEWNWGRTTNERCLITENFGRLAPERWINLSGVAQIWRPDLPLNQ
jgi:hypothetical protein